VWEVAQFGQATPDVVTGNQVLELAPSIHLKEIPSKTLCNAPSVCDYESWCGKSDQVLELAPPVHLKYIPSKTLYNATTVFDDESWCGNGWPGAGTRTVHSPERDSIQNIM
jgi:hypothetical protein